MHSKIDLYKHFLPPRREFASMATKSTKAHRDYDAIYIEGASQRNNGKTPYCVGPIAVFKIGMILYNMFHGIFKEDSNAIEEGLANLREYFENALDYQPRFEFGPDFADHLYKQIGHEHDFSVSVSTMIDLCLHSQEKDYQEDLPKGKIFVGNTLLVPSDEFIFQQKPSVRTLGDFEIKTKTEKVSSSRSARKVDQTVSYSHIVSPAVQNSTYQKESIDDTIARLKKQLKQAEDLKKQDVLDKTIKFTDLVPILVSNGVDIQSIVDAFLSEQATRAETPPVSTTPVPTDGFTTVLPPKKTKLIAPQSDDSDSDAKPE